MKTRENKTWWVDVREEAFGWKKKEVIFCVKIPEFLKAPKPSSISLHEKLLRRSEQAHGSEQSRSQNQKYNWSSLEKERIGTNELIFVSVWPHIKQDHRYSPVEGKCLRRHAPERTIWKIYE